MSPTNLYPSPRTGSIFHQLYQQSAPQTRQHPSNPRPNLQQRPQQQQQQPSQPPQQTTQPAQQTLSQPPHQPILPFYSLPQLDQILALINNSQVAGLLQHVLNMYFPNDMRRTTQQGIESFVPASLYPPQRTGSVYHPPYQQSPPQNQQQQQQQQQLPPSNTGPSLQPQLHSQPTTQPAQQTPSQLQQQPPIPPLPPAFYQFPPVDQAPALFSNSQVVSLLQHVFGMYVPNDVRGLSQGPDAFIPASFLAAQRTGSVYHPPYQQSPPQTQQQPPNPVPTLQPHQQQQSQPQPPAPSQPQPQSQPAPSQQQQPQHHQATQPAQQAPSQPQPLQQRQPQAPQPAPQSAAQQRLNQQSVNQYPPSHPYPTQRTGSTYQLYQQPQTQQQSPPNSGPNLQQQPPQPTQTQPTQPAQQTPSQPQQQPLPSLPSFYQIPQIEQALALFSNSQVANLLQHVFSLYFQNGMRGDTHHTHHHHSHYHPHIHGTHHHHPPPHNVNGQAVGADDQTVLTISESKPRGLSRAEIDSLTPYIQVDEKDSRNCVICLSKFEVKSKIRPLSCTHAFHAKCVDKWLRANRTCPICRRDALKSPTGKIKRI